MVVLRLRPFTQCNIKTKGLFYVPNVVEIGFAISEKGFHLSPSLYGPDSPPSDCYLFLPVVNDFAGKTLSQKKFMKIGCPSFLPGTRVSMTEVL